MKVKKMSLIFKKANEPDIPVVENVLMGNNLPYKDIKNINIELFLAYEDNEFIGIVGLEKFSDVALLRSMVIFEAFRGQGYGKTICNKILEIAKTEDIKEVFLLTCTAKDFFQHLGFKKISREEPPYSIRSTTEFMGLCPESAICLKIEL